MTKSIKDEVEEVYIHHKQTKEDRPNTIEATDRYLITSLMKIVGFSHSELYDLDKRKKS